MNVTGILNKILFLGILVVSMGVELGEGALIQDPPKDSGGKFFAILAGVTHYEGDELKFTKENSIERAVPELKEAFKFFAIKKGYLEHNIHICVLTDKPYQEENEQSLCRLGESKTIAPTKENINNLFTALLTKHNYKVEEGKMKRRHNSSQDTFIFYFTGHGIFHGADIQLFTSGSRGGLKGEFSGLDSDGNLINQGDFVMTLEEWEDNFKNLWSDNQFIIIDACQNQGNLPDTFGISRTLLGKRLAGVFRGGVNQANPLVLVLSSSPGEYSHIDERFHMGFFTKHLIKMLYGAADSSGDLEINSEEMGSYFNGVHGDVLDRLKKHQHADIIPYRLGQYVLYRRPYAPQTHFLLLDHNKLTLPDRLDKVLGAHINNLEFEIFSRELETELFKNHKGRVTKFKEDLNRDENFYKDLKEVILETQTCHEMTDQTKNQIHLLAQKYYPTQFPDSSHLIVGWLDRLAQENTNGKNELNVCLWFLGDAKVGSQSNVHLRNIFNGPPPPYFGQFYDDLGEKILKELENADPIFAKQKLKAESINVDPNGRTGFFQDGSNTCAKFLFELNKNFQKTDLVYWGITLDESKEGILKTLSCAVQPKNENGGSVFRSLFSGKRNAVERMGTSKKSVSDKSDSPSHVVVNKFIMSGSLHYLPKQEKVSVCGRIWKPNLAAKLFARKKTTGLNLKMKILTTFEVSLRVFLGLNDDKAVHRDDDKTRNFEDDVLQFLSLKLANRLSYGGDARWYLASDSKSEISEKCLPILD